MGKIQRVASLEVPFHRRPDGPLRRVGDEHLNDRAALDGLFQFKQCFPRFPAIFTGAVPIFLELFGLADDHFKAIVAQV